MIFTFVYLQLLRLAAGGSFECPVGFELIVGDKCASLCPDGYKADGLLCRVDCDPESDVSCGRMAMAMTFRRRLGFWNELEKEVKRVSKNVQKETARAVDAYGR